MAARSAPARNGRHAPVLRRGETPKPAPSALQACRASRCCGALGPLTAPMRSPCGTGTADRAPSSFNRIARSASPARRAGRAPRP